MAEFTKDIKQLQKTASQQPQFAPPSQSLGGDIANAIGTGLDFYAKNKAQEQLNIRAKQEAEQEKEFAKGVLGFRQLRQDLQAQDLSTVERNKRENAYIKKFSPEIGMGIVKATNTITGTNSYKINSDIEAEVEAKRKARVALEQDVADLSPYVARDIDINAPEDELQKYVLEGKARKATLDAKKAKIELESSEFSLQGKKSDRSKKLFLAEYGAMGETAYAKEARRLIGQANFNDPDQVANLIAQNNDLSSAYIQQALNMAKELDIPLTPKDAKEELAQQLDIFDSVDRLLRRVDAKEIGANEVTSQTNNMLLALASSENANQRNLAKWTMYSKLLPIDAVGKKVMDAWGGATVDLAGSNIWDALEVNKDTATPEQIREVEKAKAIGDQALKDVFSLAPDDMPEESKKALGTAMKEKLQGSRETRRRMIEEGGLVTYVKAISGGVPEALLTPEDRDEVMLGVADYGVEFFRRTIPQLLREKVPSDSNLYTRPIPPKGRETGLPLVESENVLNTIDPDTLRVTWNQNAPISDSTKKYNQFVGEFLTAMEKLGASEEEMKYYKNEIVRGFTVANQ